MRIRQEALLTALQENLLEKTHWGFCLSCGLLQNTGDAERTSCVYCEKYMVYSAEEVLAMDEYE